MTENKIRKQQNNLWWIDKKQTYQDVYEPKNAVQYKILTTGQMCLQLQLHREAIETLILYSDNGLKEETLRDYAIQYSQYFTVFTQQIQRPLQNLIYIKQLRNVIQSKKDGNQLSEYFQESSGKKSAQYINSMVRQGIPGQLYWTKFNGCQSFVVKPTDPEIQLPITDFFNFLLQFSKGCKPAIQIKQHQYHSFYVYSEDIKTLNQQNKIYVEDFPINIISTQGLVEKEQNKGLLLFDISSMLISCQKFIPIILDQDELDDLQKELYYPTYDEDVSNINMYKQIAK